MQGDQRGKESYPVTYCLSLLCYPNKEIENSLCPPSIAGLLSEFSGKHTLLSQHYEWAQPLDKVNAERIGIQIDRAPRDNQATGNKWTHTCTKERMEKKYKTTYGDSIKA